MGYVIGYMIGRLLGACLIALLITWLCGLVYRGIKKKKMPKFWLLFAILAVAVFILSTIGALAQQ
ncbi:hypothetical protein CAY60_020535 [Shouchella clausii]|jgi:predicted PurR-regulated permease PerM|uniref:Uncharacterized protein n=2 Tax=Shouchella TaxID=2893057 RepID=A0A268NXM4_SHOCL|nr:MULTISPECIES: hypothetical protein [Shouchella]MCM3314234.1 hypothetical protein [Psychrobacillus sp. MER TA 17]ALA51973.1 hypothetical protein DB29_01145 [Shouchella clausii]KKI87520.1 hypothetical protein WZ76_04630 [Shouchella clausii]MBU3230575.1 hypothetical protein [Shouchella clausii]MBU3262226.1 hypothetical protein [Shouchella clausii]